jgi:hypothetical protein
VIVTRKRLSHMDPPTLLVLGKGAALLSPLLLVCAAAAATLAASGKAPQPQRWRRGRRTAGP